MTNKTQKDPFDLAAGVPNMEGTLRPQPKFADRISKRVLFVALLVVVTVIVIFFVALQNMDNKKKSAQPKPVPKTADSSPTLPDDWGNVLDGVGTGKGISLVPKNDDKKVPLKAPGVTTAASGPIVPAIAGDNSGAVNVPPPLTPEEQAKLQERLDRLARTRKAMLEGLQAKSFSSDDKAAMSALPSSINSEATSLMNQVKGALQSAIPSAHAKSDGEQDEKQDFLRNAEKSKHSYHEHVPLAALSPNEVKTGSFIPMALEQGINSDLPGQVTARVTENVYDTITGCRLLIPAMSKVVGTYDSKVAIGQGRNLVVWNGLVFPDGSELNLAGLQAYDTSGAAGLGADVDNHYLRLFGLTFGMSMVTSAVQLSVPQPNPGVNGSAAQQSPEQIIAASLAQQYGALGAQILGKYMAVQPTLRNYPGERFVVMVPRTIVFRKVWRSRCQTTRGG